LGHVVIATWTAKPGAAEQVAAILRDMTQDNRAEPKMLHFQAQSSQTDPDTFVLYEHYTDASGYEDHRSTAAFQDKVLGTAIGLLADRKVETFSTID
jgi:quinol monooxygenase YgiN